ncbi:TPA: hypothetical protein QC443_002510 [Bacillus cereus]|uniref:hypothetical protein n=1 Tax=Bacillus paranthracis TaxID=2026186 RepID=UPI002969CF84|nr:hypothetical protein [Bacillus paranthracis]HDR8058677.1 hypothetical protein [Bacillus cereus]MED1138879.1 hypothetical protein [Bacillus paranthracis]HDR8076362.1 hypothetical protein [Bacillus cereus]HDR8207941.1 hypothetical protein [Bacillus cereus]
MKEKNYSVSVPSFSVKEKNHVISINVQNTNEKSYSISLSLSNPFGKNEHDFSISMPPNSRVKGVIEEEPIIFANKSTRVKLKGILPNITEQAIRQSEVEANVSNLDAASLEKYTELSISDWGEFSCSKELDSTVSLHEDSSLHEKTIIAEDLESEGAYRSSNTHDISIVEKDILNRLNEHESEHIITQSIFQINNIGQLADVNEFPGWINVSRTLYGEVFLEDTLTRKRQEEVNSKLIITAPSQMVIKEIETNNSEHTLAEVSLQELETISNDSIELTDRLIRELAASYEEMDLFNDQGIPVYLPEYDLFAKIQRELTADYINIATADRDVTQIDEETISFDFGNRTIPEAAGTFVETKLLERYIPEVIGNINSPYTFNRFINGTLVFNAISFKLAERTQVFHTADKGVTFEMDKIPKEISSYPIATVTLMNKKMFDFDTNIVNISDGLIGTNEYESEHVTEGELSTRQQPELYTVSNEAANAIKSMPGVETDNITILESQRFIPDITTSVINAINGERSNKELFSIQEELSLSERIAIQVNALIEEMDLFDGQGIPVYLPEYDLFAKIQRELQTHIINSDEYRNEREFSTKTIATEKMELLKNDILLEISTSAGANKLSNELVTEVIDIPSTIKSILEHNTDITGISSADRCLLEINTEVDSYDQADITIDKNAVIIEQDNADVYRQFEGIETPYDTFSREKEFKTTVSEFEQSEKTLDVDTIILTEDIFSLEKTIHANCIKFDNFIVDHIYDADITEGEMNKVVPKEEPKLWLQHSRRSWWNNSNWKKTR